MNEIRIFYDLLIIQFFFKFSEGRAEYQATPPLTETSQLDHWS